MFSLVPVPILKVYAGRVLFLTYYFLLGLSVVVVVSSVQKYITTRFELDNLYCCAKLN